MSGPDQAPAPGAPASPANDSPASFELGGADFVDIPAAIVCALCGSAECPGCAEERTKSGVVAIVAWERAGSLRSRLWSTAQSSTLDAEPFFHTLPDGPLPPALRFAFAAELCASAAMLAALAGAFAAVFPDVAWEAFADRGWRVALAAVPGLALLLVFAHAIHGVALDVSAARRRGAPIRISHGLRFGLYACGWDLVIGPLGFVVTLFSPTRSQRPFRGGVRAAFGLVGAAVGLPTKAALAFLRGGHHLDGDAAKPPLRASYVAAASATIACALVVLAAVAALVA